MYVLRTHVGQAGAPLKKADGVSATLYLQHEMIIILRHETSFSCAEEADHDTQVAGAGSQIRASSDSNKSH